MALLVPLLLLNGCTGTKDGPIDTGDAEPPMEHLFSFAILADPHIAGVPEHETRLQTAVTWINETAQERDCELVLVVGDVGWGAGLERSKELLDGLEVPYVPLVGDNEIHTGDDERYNTVYQPQFDLLATQFDDWSKAPVPVDHPLGEPAWLQNLAFEHKGVRFVGSDHIVRGVEGNLGELGSLNDFEGGTWPFLEAQLSDAASRPLESIVMAGHIPLMFGMLNVEQLEKVEVLIGPVADHVHAQYAGHLHIDYEETVDAGFELYVVDATWDDEITVRMVEVSGNGERMAYDQDLVVLE